MSIFNKIERKRLEDSALKQLAKDHPAPRKFTARSKQDRRAASRNDFDRRKTQGDRS